MESMPTQNVWYPRSHLSQNIISSSWCGCWHTVQVLHSMHCQWYVWITLTNSWPMSKQDGWPKVYGHSHIHGETWWNTTRQRHAETDTWEEHTCRNLTANNNVKTYNQKHYFVRHSHSVYCHFIIATQLSTDGESIMSQYNKPLNTETNIYLILPRNRSEETKQMHTKIQWMTDFPYELLEFE